MLRTLRRFNQRALNRRFNHWLPPADEIATTLRPLPWEVGRRGELSGGFWDGLGKLASDKWLANAGMMATSWPAAETVIMRLDAGTVPARPFARLDVRTSFASIEGGKLMLTHEVRLAGGELVGRAISQTCVRPDVAFDAFPPHRRSLAA